MRNTVTMQWSSLGDDDQKGMIHKLYVILQTNLMFHGEPCRGFVFPTPLKANMKVLSSLLTQALITVMEHYMYIKEREKGIK